MRGSIYSSSLLLCLCLSLAAPVSADSFRCGRKLVSSGDSSGDLMRKCGEPRYKDRGQAMVRVDGVTRKVGVERWYYKKSSRSLQHVVVLYRGRVTAVEVGGR